MSLYEKERREMKRNKVNAILIKSQKEPKIYEEPMERNKELTETREIK